MGGGMQSFPGEFRGMRHNVRHNLGIAGKRPDRKALRRLQAAQRLVAYANLPLVDKEARNPSKYRKYL